MHFFLLTFALLLAASSSSAAQTTQAPQPTSTGKDLLQSGKFAEARDAFENVLNDDAANKDAQSGEVAASEGLALDARRKGHMKGALTYLMRAQQFVPRDPRLLFDLGIQENEMQMYQDADRTLALAEQLNPADPNVIYAVGRVKLDLGQLSPAEEKLKAYLKFRPNDATAHFGLGRAYQLGLQFDQARAEFQRCVELQPVQTEAYYQLGDIEQGDGNFAEAISEYGKPLARNPKHSGALAGTGHAYFKQKQYLQAEEFLERAVTAAPEYETGHYYLGLTLPRLGRKKEAAHELAVAAKLADAASKRARSALYLNPSTPINEAFHPQFVALAMRYQCRLH